MQEPHRKRLKRYHSPGDLHEFTFSCFQRMPLLMDDERRRIVCHAIDAANARYQMLLVAFVIMPEHVHLLVDPVNTQPDLSGYLAAIKRPSSYRIKESLVGRNESLLTKLTVLERPGKTAFRFWQEGGGFDRNVNRPATVLAAINYVHHNPVRRGLVENAADWKWSSCRWYVSDAPVADADLPTIHGLRVGSLDR